MNTKNFLGPLVVSMSLALSCGDDGGPTAPVVTPPSQASITISTSPAPITATQSNEPGFSWMAEFTITIRETAGIACNVNFISLASGNVLLVDGADDIIAKAGTNHINPRGSLTVPFRIHYNSVAGDREVAWTVSVEVTDERGNVITVGSTVNFQLKGNANAD